MPKKYIFDTVILTENNDDFGYIEIPFDTKKEFNTKGQIKVAANIDGYCYRGSLVKMGHHCHILGINKTIRKAINKNPGDTVHIELIKDYEERIVSLPTDLTDILKSTPDLLIYLNGLSYTCKKEYVEFINQAKKTETRQRRIYKTIDLIRESFDKKSKK